MDVWRLLIFIFFVNIFTLIFQLDYFTPIYGSTMPYSSQITLENMTAMKQSMESVMKTNPGDISQALAYLWGLIQLTPIAASLFKMLFGLSMIVFQLSALIFPTDIAAIFSFAAMGFEVFVYANVLIQLFRGIKVS